MPWDRDSHDLNRVLYQVWSDGPVLGVAMTNRKDPRAQEDINNAKTFAVCLESTEMSNISTVDCFDTRHGRALPSCGAGV
jgi:hypothetical protein